MLEKGMLAESPLTYSTTLPLQGQALAAMTLCGEGNLKP